MKKTHKHPSRKTVDLRPLAAVAILATISLPAITSARTIGIEGEGVIIRPIDKTYRYKSDHLDTSDWNDGLIFPSTAIPALLTDLEYATYDFRPESEDSRTTDSIDRFRADEAGDLLIAMPSDSASGEGWTRLNDGGPDFYLDRIGRYKSASPDINYPYWLYTRTYEAPDVWVNLPANSQETDLPPFIFAEDQELRFENPLPLPHGTVITRLPEGGNLTTLANPKMIVASNGDYFASIRGSVEASSTSLFKSTDKGETWSFVGGDFYLNRDSLFEHDGALYMIGWNTSGAGNTRIYKSIDHGESWTTQTFVGRGGGDAPSHVLISGGRIWKAADPSNGPGFFSAPIDADLMLESSWSLGTPGSGPIETLANGEQFRKKAGEPEGTLFLLEDGTPVNAIKGDIFRPNVGFQDGIPLIMADLDDPSTTTHNPDFAGPLLPDTDAKYTILFDPISDRYWAITSGGTNRGQLNLYSASSFKGGFGDFVLERVILEGVSTSYHGFNYPFIQFDGEDLVFALRTAWETDRGQATRWHDGNIFTFHRIENFRRGTSGRAGGSGVGWINGNGQGRGYGKGGSGGLGVGLENRQNDNSGGNTSGVSQSFEYEGEGHPFTTNLVATDFSQNVVSHTFGFPDALFGGDTFNDYATIYPNYADTLSASNDGLVGGQDGLSFVMVEDTEANGDNLPNAIDDSLILTFAPVDISKASDVDVTIAAAAPRAGGYTSGSTLQILASIDEEPSIVMGEFNCNSNSGGSMALDTDNDGVGDSTNLSSVFQDFTFNVPVNGSEVVIIIIARSANGSDEIAFDNVRIVSN